MEIVSTAGLQQEVSTETVANVSRYSGTLAASITYSCSSWPPLSYKIQGEKHQLQSLYLCWSVDGNNRKGS